MMGEEEEGGHFALGMGKRDTHSPRNEGEDRGLKRVLETEWGRKDGLWGRMEGCLGPWCMQDNRNFV